MPRKARHHVSPVEKTSPVNARWAAGGVLVVVVIISLGVAWVRSTYRGSPSQVRQTEGRIAQIRAESFDTLVENLLADDQIYSAPSLTGRMNSQIDLERCLSSRRVLRVWQFLRELPPSERIPELRRLSDRVHAEYCANAEWVLRKTADPSAQERHNSFVATRMAVCACWWMSSNMDDLEGLLLDMARTEQFAGAIREKVSHDVRYSDLEFWCGFALELDNACKLNVLALAIEQRAKRFNRQDIALRDILKRLALPTRHLVLTEWDAEVGTFDVVHAFEGVALDCSKGFNEYDLCYWGDREYDLDFQKQALDQVNQRAADVALGKK